MDKPVSLSMKAWIIRNMSVRTATQESVIETVVNHQFESAYVALENCNGLEFSGFGKFLFNRPKAIKKLERMKNQIEQFNQLFDDENITEVRRRNIQMKLPSLIKSFEGLNKKLNGIEQDIRGMEKQAVSPKGIEEIDSEGSGRENVNM